MPFSPGQYVFVERSKYLSLAAAVPDTVQIVEECVSLEGFQVYIVERWVPTRSKLSDTVTVFTGDAEHKISACVLNLQKRSNGAGSLSKLESLFNQFDEDKARPKQSSRGTIMVTSLSTFSNDHNYILVPDGDYEAHISNFYLNLNLKRLGCTGRSGLNLNNPTRSQIAKFHSLYKTLDTESFKSTVLDLVRYVQIALHLFGLLHVEYIDGLLCDDTQKGIEQFVEDYGPFEMGDVVMDPTVCAALLSKIVAIRHKLNSMGHQVGKDPFNDIYSFCNGVQSFQKSAKLTNARARMLDKETVQAIYDAYDSKSNPQPLKVHRAIKSKIEDFSGLHSTLIDIETTDIEMFGKNVGSDPLKYLWKARPTMGNIDADWLHGGKEFGKNLLKGVSGRKIRTSEAIKGFKENVTGSITRSLEGFVDKTSRLGKASHLREVTSEFEGTEIDNFPDTASLIGELSSPEDTEFPSTRFMYTDDRLIDRKSEKVAFPPVMPAPRRSASSALMEKQHATRTVQNHRRWSYTQGEKISISSIRMPKGSMDLNLHTFILYNELKAKEATLRKLIDHMKSKAYEYSVKVATLSIQCEAKEVDHKENRADTMQIFEKQENVMKTIKHLTINSSKTQYELSVLEDKFKEVEEVVDTFLAKVNRIESQVLSIQ